MATYTNNYPIQVLTYFGLSSNITESFRYDATTIAKLQSIETSRNRIITLLSNIHPDGRNNYSSPGDNYHFAWNISTSSWYLVPANSGNWIARVISTDTPTITKTPTVTPTPTITKTPTVTPTPTLTNQTEDCIANISPKTLEFIADPAFDIILQIFIPDCYEKCVVELQIIDINSNKIYTENFIVPDDNLFCITRCSDDKGYKSQNNFYITYKTNKLIVGNNHLLTASIKCLSKTIKNTTTIIIPKSNISDKRYECCTPTPTLITPTPTPTRTPTPTITPTSTYTYSYFSLFVLKNIIP